MKFIANLIFKLILWRLNGRQYDFLVDDDYLERWHLIKRNKYGFNIYFHKFIGSDADTPHDHPWWSISFILSGQYIELTTEGDFIRKSGSLTFRKATGLHWIEIDKPVYTLFITGKKTREWGFKCPNGWFKHDIYFLMRGPERKASGCGEFIGSEQP